MNNTKKPGQVGHIIDKMVAIAAIDFVSCSRILIGEIRGATNRIVVIGGKTGETTAIVARQDSGEDMHAPLLSAIYVDFDSAADAYLTRADQVYHYAEQAKWRKENRRSSDLHKAGTRLSEKSREYRRMARAS